MSIEARYHEQVRLLVTLLPFLNDEPCFALKGGTAINLFVQPFPRLSVDIDLAYLPLEPRDEALQRCRQALQRSAYSIGDDKKYVKRMVKSINEYYLEHCFWISRVDIYLAQTVVVVHKLLRWFWQLAVVIRTLAST